MNAISHFFDPSSSNSFQSPCPITIPFTIPPLILENKMIFPATIATLLSILVLWLLLVLLFGRGWCGGFCFFGWMDQLSASILKKPLLRLDTVPRWAKLFPYAFVLLLILVSLIALSPVYCSKICPLRIFYDPPMVTTNAGWGLALIFIIGGFILFFAGPFLTKKRRFRAVAVTLDARERCFPGRALMIAVLLGVWKTSNPIP
ncbi:MAG: hypothetical protein METHP_01605 [Methanoregula sp. SKADARSKE-2]|nr:MAG: hypothetical protein METHP_01605 [Methanoregula sp. SKADARSKE-2]